MMMQARAICLRLKAPEAEFHITSDRQAAAVEDMVPSAVGVYLFRQCHENIAGSDFAAQHACHRPDFAGRQTLGNADAG